MKIKLTEHEAKHIYVDESEIHGKGVFAKKDIKSGTYLGEYLGKKTKKNGMHVLWVEEEEGEWVGRDGNNALRYLNHSTKPCAEFDGYELYAIKKIKKDQEVTFDYGEEP